MGQMVVCSCFTRGWRRIAIITWLPRSAMDHGEESHVNYVIIVVKYVPRNSISGFYFISLNILLELEKLKLA